MRKRIIVCLLLLSALLLGACGAEKPADPAQFLADMAGGLQARLDLSEQEEQLPRSPEEQAEYEQRLVRCELDRIERYESLSFEDPRFDELAHRYIQACRQQSFAAGSRENESLYRTLWEAGYAARAAIITELWTSYGLPLDEKQAESYARAIAPAREEEEEPDYSSNLRLRALPAWTEHYSNGNYYHYDALVSNENAGEDLLVTVLARFYDSEGREIGSARETLNALSPGSTQYCRLRSDSPFARAELSLEQVERDTGFAGAAGSLQTQVSLADGKLYVSVSNGGALSVSRGSVYCVLYLGEQVADVQSGGFASPDKPLDPGQSRTAEIRLRKSPEQYDRVEIYLRAMGER